MPAADRRAKSDAELLSHVVSSAPIVLFAFDAGGIFTLSEGRGLDALGLKSGEAVGKSVFDLYKDHPAVLENCRRALKGETLTAVVPVGPIVFETRYVPQLDWGGKVTGVLGVATDVSDAYRNSLAKDEFLSVISHELRTPLSSAAGWAWMLKEEELSEAESSKALETIVRNLDDLKRLIQELRDASHAATGVLELKTAPCDFAACVRAAAATVASAAEAKGVAVLVSTQPARLRGDKARLRQIAWILLANAVKYAPKGGSVEVRLVASAAEAVLSVADDGPGVDPSLRAHVFDLARMPAAVRAPRGRGLGLGLTIARRLAELHGGTVACSDERAKGALFTVRLPLSTK